MSVRKSLKRKQPDEEPQNQNNDPEDDEELKWSDDEGEYVDGIHIPPPARSITISTSDTRLIITKISNNFFKSYAQHTILGPFSKCFNAIVGPNGSGKSNVIDSMLFVFGYRANRIRCKKLSVLLHNSETYRNVQSCTVAVHFCQIRDKTGDGYEILPGSEFVVSRTAHKDNTSYYELNSRRVQFKEVAKLLRHHGIDLDHNRFLILQGEVEEIAMMKSKGATESETGMLEYLEDIIGTNRYKKPLLQLADRIELINVQRSEKINRITLIEKELEQLKGPMEESMNFLRSENKIATCQNILYQKKIYELEEKKKEIETDKDQISESRDQMIEKIKSIASAKSEKEEELKLKSGKYDKLTHKKDQLKEAFNAADKKDVQLQAEMVQTNNNRKKFKQQLEDEKKKLLKLERVPEENLKSIQECEAKEAELTTKREKLEEEKTKLLSDIRAETKDLQIDKEKLEVQLARLKKSVDETKCEYNLAASELKEAQSREQTENNKLEELRERVKTGEATVKQSTEEVTLLKRKVPLTEKSLNDARKELNEVKREIVMVSEDAKRKRRGLEETRASMQMTKSRGRVLDSLMQQKREGKCPGLYGRLGDLGSIDKRYDVAISTACGPLDNVVVEDVNTAQWCINFLKQHDVGRATFIALEKQEYLRDLANSTIRTPENVHRLFDLIQVQDERVKTAFYYALRDTLVADDLDQATRIAYGEKRFRVVTLKGDLIETSGTLSGGGKSISRGRMGQSVLASNIHPKDIQTMETSIEQCEKRFIELSQKQTSLQSQIDTLEPELNAMTTNLEKFTRSLHSLKEELPRLKQLLRQQENVAKASKSDAKQIEKLTKVVDSKKAKYDEASEAAQEIQVQVDELMHAINEKTSGKMKKVDKNLAETTRIIDNAKSEITRLRVAITTSERNVKKTVQKIGTLERNIVDAENKLREMKVERDTIEEDGKKLLTCIKEITEQLEVGQEEYGELKQEVSALIDEEKQLLLKKVDVDQTFKIIKEKMNECNSTINQWHAKLTQLKLHDIPDETSELPRFSLEELQSKNMEVVELELQAAQDAIKKVKPNLNVIQEYRRGRANYMERTKELELITTKKHEMKSVLDRVTNQRREEFMIGYNIIKLKLKEMYQMITLGGDADFEILDSYDPFTEGVQLNIRPPRKTWKAISNLSGGEKTLSSLALVFALHYYKPSPLYVMDEIDAALDFKNVSIVGHYIKERTKNAQFIIISLRSNMFELCDNLVGIYKIFNCTRTIAIDPREFGQKTDQSNGVIDQDSPTLQESESVSIIDREERDSSESVTENVDAVINDSFEQSMDTA